MSGVPTNGPRLIAAAVCAVVGVVGIMLVRPNSDNLAPITALLGFLGLYLKAASTHDMVNSRLDAWVKASSDIARQEGRDERGTKEPSHEPPVAP